VKLNTEVLKTVNGTKLTVRFGIKIECYTVEKPHRGLLTGVSTVMCFQTLT